MGKLSADAVDALHADLRPVAARLDELAGKHGVSAVTIKRHLNLPPVPIRDLPAWNSRIAGQ
jgi:hypothetical protein